MPDLPRRGDDPAVPAGPVALGQGLWADLSRTVADVAPPGIRAYAARWDNSVQPAVAMLSTPGRPARMVALEALGGAEVSDCLVPLRHGAFGVPGGDYVVVVAHPRGQPVLRRGQRITPWSEESVLQEFLRPVARVLHTLHGRGFPHRGIRPDNLFFLPGQPGVVLGEAWIAPPGAFQPGWVEPLGSSASDSDGRGEGTPACDIFALGATALALLLGGEPAGTPAEVQRLRLERSSFGALASGVRVGSRLLELLRAMLSDEAIQRPHADAVLQVALGAAVRRVVPRPIRRAARPFELKSDAIFDPRSLANALASDWPASLRLIETNDIEGWARRGLSDTPLATRIEAVRNGRASSAAGAAVDDVALMKVIALLDPGGPIAWRGQRFLPGGIAGQAAAALQAGEGPAGDLLDFLLAGGVPSWLAAVSEVEGDKLSADRAVRELRTLASTPAPLGGIRRVVYQLNPLLGCRSPLLRGRPSVGIAAVLQGLDQAAAEGALPAPLVLDADLVAYLAAQTKGALDHDLRQHAALKPAAEAARLLRVLGILQRESRPGPLPGLAAALAREVHPLLQTYRSRSRRKAIGEDLDRLAQAGNIDALLMRIEHAAERRADLAGFGVAEAQAALLRDRLQQLADQRPKRRERAMQLGADIASGLGWIGVVAATLSMFTS